MRISDLSSDVCSSALVITGLTRLKRNHIIAPASNGNIALMVNMAKRAHIPWDAILGAEVTQAYKPSPPAYTRMVEILGLEPQEVCMVAAHNNDLHAARQCGLSTAFVARKTEHGANQTTDLEPSEDWDIIASDFRSEEPTSELQSLMRISYAVFCLTKKKK